MYDETPPWICYDCCCKFYTCDFADSLFLCEGIMNFSSSAKCTRPFKDDRSTSNLYLGFSGCGLPPLCCYCYCLAALALVTFLEYSAMSDPLVFFTKLFCMTLFALSVLPPPMLPFRATLLLPGLPKYSYFSSID